MNTIISKTKFILLAFVALSVVHCSKGGGGTTSTAPSATTCPANQLYTVAGGCLPQCGTNMVYYNNQCVAVSAVTTVNSTCNPTYVNGQMRCSTTGTGNIPGNPYGTQNICSGQCGAGQVQTANGCLPQGQCGACYGQNNGWCYIGTNAHQYYGY